MAYLVSPCCGAEYSDHCDDEGYECHQCSHCKDFFSEPLEDYEYDSRIRESIAEDRMDEKRLGL
tara:strand:+ start:558 stop:749 length:192 start_codon:yes stop_codon:yes gene_type:complete